jgi:hypothetical protein
MESFSVFTGFSDCLLEIDRQSKKRLETAITKLEENIPKYKEWFKTNRDITIKEKSK